MKSKRKSQNIIEGAILQINISENRKVFARLFSIDIGVYDLCLQQDEETPDLNLIVQKSIFHYCSVYNSIIKKGLFRIIGCIPLTQNETNNIPPRFEQDKGNYNCNIFWNDGTEREALPEECRELEPNMVWGYKEIIERIEDHFAGKRNFDVEFNKVILSEADPRYRAMHEGKKLKWDFVKRKFYLTEDPTV